MNMSMNREAYRLANELRTDSGADEAYLIDSLGDLDMKKYKNTVLREIKKDKQYTKKSFRGLAVAACAAVAVLAGTAVLSEEVHAAIRQIRYSLSSALGLSTDLAGYREVVNTSVSDKGYVITLDEVVVSQDTLVASYTVTREGGESMQDMPVPDGSLSINGERVSVSGSGSAGFLDEEQTVLGVVEAYQVSKDTNLALENDVRLTFGSLGHENPVHGKWEFAFSASGSDLIADTRHIAIGKDFELPDGTKVTLEEYTSNELEQRIFFSWSGGTRYLLMVMATDQNGNQVEYGVRSSDAKSGYLQNEEYVGDGRLGDDAGTVTMTLYAVKLPDTDGQISDDYVQIGEAFEIEI